MTDCDHGITFMGPANATAIIRKRWPRGFFTPEHPCPKGCGYVGIYYASQAHYLYGDW